MVEAETWKWIKALNGSIEGNKNRIDSILVLTNIIVDANVQRDEGIAYCIDTIIDLRKELERQDSRLSRLEGNNK